MLQEPTTLTTERGVKLGYRWSGFRRSKVTR
jgi:hypothetical protein